MIVILVGAPGAGKGTQADLLAERAGFRKISTGDALRKHVKLGTPVGKKAASIMAEGHLVPDDVLLGVLTEELGTNQEEKILLDGYPRNISQAETLGHIGKTQPVKAVIHLDVGRDELIRRLTGRRVCRSCQATYHSETMPPKVADKCDRCGGLLEQRSDDSREKVSVRLDVYEDATKPILDFYQKQRLYHKVMGAGPTEDVYRQVAGVLGELSLS